MEVYRYPTHSIFASVTEPFVATVCNAQSFVTNSPPVFPACLAAVTVCEFASLGSGATSSMQLSLGSNGGILFAETRADGSGEGALDRRRRSISSGS